MPKQNCLNFITNLPAGTIIAIPEAKGSKKRALRVVITIEGAKALVNPANGDFDPFGGPTMMRLSRQSIDIEYTPTTRKA